MLDIVRLINGMVHKQKGKISLFFFDIRWFISFIMLCTIIIFIPRQDRSHKFLFSFSLPLHSTTHFQTIGHDPGQNGPQEAEIQRFQIYDYIKGNCMAGRTTLNLLNRPSNYTLNTGRRLVPVLSVIEGRRIETH